MKSISPHALFTLAWQLRMFKCDFKHCLQTHGGTTSDFCVFVCSRTDKHMLGHLLRPRLFYLSVCINECFIRWVFRAIVVLLLHLSQISIFVSFRTPGSKSFSEAQAPQLICCTDQPLVDFSEAIRVVHAKTCDISIFFNFNRPLYHKVFLGGLNDLPQMWCTSLFNQY